MTRRHPWPPPKRTSTSSSFIPDTPITVPHISGPVGQDAYMSKIQVSASPDLRGIALGVIREVLSEENTDALIDTALDHIHLPVWLRWIPLRSVLDRLLPGVILKVFEDVLG